MSKYILFAIALIFAGCRCDFTAPEVDAGQAPIEAVVDQDAQCGCTNTETDGGIDAGAYSDSESEYADIEQTVQDAIRLKAN